MSGRLRGLLQTELMRVRLVGLYTGRGDRGSAQRGSQSSRRDLLLSPCLLVCVFGCADIIELSGTVWGVSGSALSGTCPPDRSVIAAALPAPFLLTHGILVHKMSRMVAASRILLLTTY